MRPPGIHHFDPDLLVRFLEKRKAIRILRRVRDEPPKDGDEGIAVLGVRVPLGVRPLAGDGAGVGRKVVSPPRGGCEAVLRRG